MRRSNLLLLAIGSVCLLGSCTERRTASDPVPDGDTVEVTIVDPATNSSPDAEAKQPEAAVL